MYLNMSMNSSPAPQVKTPLRPWRLCPPVNPSHEALAYTGIFIHFMLIYQWIIKLLLKLLILATVS